MGSITNKEIPQEFSMWSDIFNLRKKYFIPEDNVQHGLDLIAEADVIYRKYNTALCYELIWSVLNDYERVAKVYEKTG